MIIIVVIIIVFLFLTLLTLTKVKRTPSSTPSSSPSSSPTPSCCSSSSPSSSPSTSPTPFTVTVQNQCQGAIQACFTPLNISNPSTQCITVNPGSSEQATFNDAPYGVLYNITPQSIPQLSVAEGSVSNNYTIIISGNQCNLIPPGQVYIYKIDNCQGSQSCQTDVIPITAYVLNVVNQTNQTLSVYVTLSYGGGLATNITSQVDANSSSVIVVNINNSGFYSSPLNVAITAKSNGTVYYENLSYNISPTYFAIVMSYPPSQGPPNINIQNIIQHLIQQYSIQVPTLTIQELSGNVVIYNDTNNTVKIYPSQPNIVNCQVIEYPIPTLSPGQSATYQFTYNCPQNSTQIQYCSVIAITNDNGQYIGSLVITQPGTYNVSQAQPINGPVNCGSVSPSSSSS